MKFVFTGQSPSGFRNVEGDCLPGALRTLKRLRAKSSLDDQFENWSGNDVVICYSKHQFGCKWLSFFHVIARSEATRQSVSRHSRNAIARQGNQFHLTDKLKFGDSLGCFWRFRSAYDLRFSDCFSIMAVIFCKGVGVWRIF